MSAGMRDCNRNVGGSTFSGLPSLVIAAHELKAPLALVRQLSLTLEDGKILKSDRQKMLRQISLTSERALRLTSDLTRAIKIPDALFTLEPINPQQLCEDIIKELSPMFKAHERRLKFVSKRHSLLLVANRDLLRRVIMNFSDNALQYAGCDSAVEIKIKTVDFGKAIQVGVRDYGPTLPIDLVKSMQNKLNDVSIPIQNRPQSSGLGLYIVSQFANAMNGKIGVTRHRNGATFYVELSSSNQLSLL